MKFLPFDIDAPDLSLAYGCKLILKDGTVMGFTSHDRDAAIDQVVYKAKTGVYRNAIAAQNKLSVPNMEMVGFIDSDAITDVDLRAGRYQDAVVQHFLYNWQNPEAGIIKLPASGWLGTVKRQHPIGWTATTLGLLQAYQTNQGALYSPDCRNDLGDNFCKVDLTPFTQAGVVVAVTSGHLTFTATATGGPFNETTQLAVPAWQSKHRYFPGEAMLLEDDDTFFYVCVQTNSYSNGNVPLSGGSAPDPAEAEGDTIIDGDIVWQATLHDWYFDGRLVWTSGANMPYPGSILTYTIGTPATFTLQSSAPFPIQAGDKFTVEAGCGKLFYVCRAKFANQLNFNGENTAPGQEAYLDYPDQEK